MEWSWHEELSMDPVD